VYLSTTTSLLAQYFHDNLIHTIIIDSIFHYLFTSQFSSKYDSDLFNTDIISVLVATTEQKENKDLTQKPTPHRICKREGGDTL